MPPLRRLKRGTFEPDRHLALGERGLATSPAKNCTNQFSRAHPNPSAVRESARTICSVARANPSRPRLAHGETNRSRPPSARQPEQLPPDQHAPDLAGPGADLVQLGVPEQPPRRVVV